MSRYFVPKLDPSQVRVPSEYVVAHGGAIPARLEESFREADKLLDRGERIRYALAASFSLSGKTYSGVVMVTTHHLYCCSSERHNLISVTMPFTHCIGIGDVSGFLRKSVRIHCEDVSVEVSGSAIEMSTLSTQILLAIEVAPNQKPLAYPGQPQVFEHSAEQHKAIEKIKAAHKNEVRLGKAEAEIYEQCSCGKKSILVKRGRRVYCLACGQEVKPRK